jgi:hypothetical protein
MYDIAGLDAMRRLLPGYRHAEMGDEESRSRRNPAPKKNGKRQAAGTAPAAPGKIKKFSLPGEVVIPPPAAGMGIGSGDRQRRWRRQAYQQENKQQTGGYARHEFDCSPPNNRPRDTDYSSQKRRNRSSTHWPPLVNAITRFITTSIKS